MRFVLPLLLAALPLAACTAKKTTNNNTSVASVVISRLQVPASSPQWQAGELMLTEDSGTTIDNSFTSSSGSDFKAQVPYGVYKINVIYRDNTGKILYQRCAKDRDLKATIQTPVFHTDLAVCREGSSTPIAQTEADPASGSGRNGNPGTNANQGTQQQPGLALADNPFTGATMYIDPTYVANVQSSLTKQPDLAAAMAKMQQVSTALWLDTTGRLVRLKPFLDGAKASQGSQKSVASVVVYNLPDRDCAAASSNGELLIAQQGLDKYKAYIDQIAATFAAYPDLRIAAMIEPDSLGNLATNLSVAKCAAAQSTYKEGVAYAVKTLAKANVSLYLDAGHSGWLGWANNRQAFAAVVRQVLDQAGGVHLIRGFATNVSNYSPLSASGSYAWYDASNPSIDELTYTRLLAKDLDQAGIINHHFVIDTSRNGVLASRQVWGNWCNIRLAGIGTKPVAAPADGIDAYLWIKTPGESDGTNDPSAPRYDANCRSQDAVTALTAPQAGDWFPEQFATLVRNAN